MKNHEARGEHARPATEECRNLGFVRFPTPSCSFFPPALSFSLSLSHSDSHSSTIVTGVQAYFFRTKIPARMHVLIQTHPCFRILFIRSVTEPWSLFPFPFFSSSRKITIKIYRLTSMLGLLLNLTLKFHLLLYVLNGNNFYMFTCNEYYFKLYVLIFSNYCNYTSNFACLHLEGQINYLIFMNIYDNTIIENISCF